MRKKKSPDVNSKSEREKKKVENEMAETGGQRCGMLAKYWKTTQKERKGGRNSELPAADEFIE